MDIKLKARLSAYSKLESLSGLQSNVPDPDATAAGNVLGVNDIGKYTLFPSIDHSDIDTLFQDVIPDETVTKEEINELFKDEEIDQTVTKEEINTLFEQKDEIESVDKDDIDTLFNNKEDSIGTVSYAQIDSLFN